MHTEVVVGKDNKKTIIVKLTKKEILGITSKKIDIDLKDVINVILIYPSCKRLISRYYLTKKFAYDLMQEYVKILKMPNNIVGITKNINNIDWEIYSLLKLEGENALHVLNKVLSQLKT